jgi:hypothetical protein
MGKIVVTTNLSLDGVVEDPDGKEGSRLGGWFGEFGGEDLGPWARLETDETLGADACSWAGGVRSGSPRGGRPGPASGRTS